MLKTDEITTGKYILCTVGALFSHGFVSTAGPVQLAPLFWGGGLVHVRVRLDGWLGKQAEQVTQALHGDQAPSDKNTSVIGLVYFRRVKKKKSSR